jgi:hypothetical protein
MTRRRSKKEEAELTAKWAAAMKAAVRNIFTKADGGASAWKPEWRFSFEDELGNRYIIRRYPPQGDAPAGYSVTVGGMWGRGPDGAERGSVAHSRAEAFKRDLEQRDAKERQREINRRNAKKERKPASRERKVTHEELRERWQLERDKPGMTFYKFSITQDDASRSKVERAIPEKLRR